MDVHTCCIAIWFIVEKTSMQYVVWRQRLSIYVLFYLIIEFRVYFAYMVHSSYSYTYSPHLCIIFIACFRFYFKISWYQFHLIFCFYFHFSLFFHIYVCWFNLLSINDDDYHMCLSSRQTCFYCLVIVTWIAIIERKKKKCKKDKFKQIVCTANTFFSNIKHEQMADFKCDQNWFCWCFVFLFRCLTI